MEHYKPGMRIQGMALTLMIIELIMVQYNHSLKNRVD